MKKRYKDILIFIMGLALCAYPVISNMIEYHSQNKVIATYESESQELTQKMMDQMYADAKKWNEDLYMAQKGISTYDSSQYNDILNISDGVMGSIEIPNIDVNLPIYHGTGNEILSIGAGHLEDTSFPVGGKNTHCVLTGHRGLPSSSLFTRLDELEIGDQFYIHVFNKIHAYEIDNIAVADPEDITGFEIEDEKDLVSLVTCTPYGINTQRLVITGHRVKYVPEDKESIEKKLPSLREIILMMIPVLLLIAGLVYFIKSRKEKKDEETH